MSFNLPAFVRDQASAAGIPDSHIGAVVDRALRGLVARNKLGGLTPLVGSGSSLVIVASLEGIQSEIDAATRALCRRIVARAAADHAAGLLERRL